MTQHEEFIRICHQLAIEAGEKGDHPFGALLALDDKILMKAKNTVNSDKDPTHHAELNLVVASQRTYPPDLIKNSTLYASTAPCLMCTAAMWSAGIRRIVYSVTYEAFAKKIPGKNRYIKCSDVYRQLGTEAEITEGVLEEEGLLVYNYWPKN